ncbi:MAG: Ig-like domain-containing protein [Acidobacteriota bacterium]
MTVMEWDQYCGLYNLGPYDVTNSCQYVSNNTAIATVNATGGVTFVSVGSTTITMSITYYHSEPISAEDCGMVEATESENCPVAVKPTVSSIDVTKGVVGSTYSLEITGTGFAQGATVSLSPNTGVTVSGVVVAGATSIFADFAIADTASGGNRRVIVTVMTQSSTDNVNFFVQIPSRITIESQGELITCDPTLCTIDNQPNKCGAYRIATYQLADQNGQAISTEGSVTEFISEWSDQTETTVFEKSAQIGADGRISDLVGFAGTGSSCPINGDGFDRRQKFKVTVNNKSFDLTTKQRLQGQKSLGQYSISITTAVQ